MMNEYPAENLYYIVFWLSVDQREAQSRSVKRAIGKCGRLKTK